MRHGEVETHLNYRKKEATAATVAMNSPPLQATRVELAESESQPS
jgi:hypothetical protein